MQPRNYCFVNIQKVVIGCFAKFCSCMCCNYVDSCILTLLASKVATGCWLASKYSFVSKYNLSQSYQIQNQFVFVNLSAGLLKKNSCKPQIVGFIISIGSGACIKIKLKILTWHLSCVLVLGLTNTVEPRLLISRGLPYK